MTFIIGDRVHELSTISGTGTYDLDGAESAMQGFVAGVGDGNATYYVASRGTEWEIGIGTVTSGVPSTLSRDTILDSSNAGSAVNWGDTNPKDLLCTVPSSQFDRRAVQVSGNFDIDPDMPNVVYECIGASGQIVASLPAGADAKSGFEAPIINAGSGTLQVSIRADGYPTGEEIDGSITGFVLLRPSQSATMRLLDSEDNWTTVSDGNLFIGDILASGVNRTLLRTSGDGDGVMEGATADLGSGALARGSSLGTAFTDTDEPDWLITVKSSTEITFKNETGGTIEFFQMVETSPRWSGSLADNASINITGLGTDERFFFQAGSITTGQTIRVEGFVSALNYYLNWMIGR
jgi:hypothetical protein